MSVCISAPLANAFLADGFCAGILPISPVSQPRSIVAVGPTDFLTLERGTGSVLVAEDLDGDGVPESTRTLVTSSGLNHGLAVTTTHLYASQSTHVYRWPYDPISKQVTGEQETVIFNINADGSGGAPFGHSTRTLAFDPTGSTLYVSVGSNANIDANSFRSRIRRFPLDDETQLPIDFLTGEVFADGLRNEVAMEFDASGVLWGAGNSADRLERDDLGGDIHNDNPAEEVHRFAGGVGEMNYGYPFCWREHELAAGLGRGTAWAWPTTMDEITDEQCRNDYASPVLAMPAHSAPLGMTFYQYQQDRPSPACDTVSPFPEAMNGDAFVAFHGSWNRDIPTGYKVVRLPIADDGTGVVGGIGADPIDVLAHSGTGAKWSDGFRPVDVSFDECGRLLVTSDGTRTEGVWSGDYIVRIESTPSVNTTTGGSTLTPVAAAPPVEASTADPVSAPTDSATPSDPAPAPTAIPTAGPSSNGTMFILKSGLLAQALAVFVLFISDMGRINM